MPKFGLEGEEYMEKVSIVIPMFNAESYIERCLDSLINQSYLNIEIVVVDDGSTDKSKEIVKDMVERRGNIVLKATSNGGASRARNLGMEICSGEYIMFVDADDYVHRDMVNEFMKACDGSKDKVLVMGNNYEVLSKGYELRKLFSYEKESCELTKVEVLRSIGEGGAGLVCCKLFSSSLVKENNIYFDEKIKMCEDQLFFLEIAKHCKDFVYLNKELYYYNRDNSNAITSKYLENAYSNQLYVLERIKEVFKENLMVTKQDESIISARFKKALWYCFNNEISTMNIKNIKSRIRNTKKIITDSRLMYLDFNEINEGRIERIICEGIEKRRIISTNLKLIIIIKILLPIKDYMKRTKPLKG